MPSSPAPPPFRSLSLSLMRTSPSTAAGLPSTLTSRCAHCTSHAYLAFGRPLARACQMDSLLGELPIETSEARAWSMRLASSILELASFGFDVVDVGEAPMQSWQTVTRHGRPPASFSPSLSFTPAASGVPSCPPFSPPRPLTLHGWASRV